jgi:hypothetical protein
MFFFILLLIYDFNLLSQNPVWPLNDNWNQINCSFAEKHSAFHGALDINLANNSNFRTILDGIVEDDAHGQPLNDKGELKYDFFTIRHNFLVNSSNSTYLKYSRYGDITDPLVNIIGMNRPGGPSIIQTGTKLVVQ